MFDDMDVCYDCLYNFQIDPVDASLIPLSLDELEEPERNKAYEGEYAYRARTVTIGRSSCNDIVLAAPNISRFHARVSFTQRGIFLEDLKSTNGIRFNGRKIDGIKEMKIGDRFIIGGMELDIQPTGVVCTSPQERDAGEVE